MSNLRVLRDTHEDSNPPVVFHLVCPTNHCITERFGVVVRGVDLDDRAISVRLEVLRDGEFAVLENSLR